MSAMPELQLVFNGINDIRFFELLENLRKAPNHHLHISALETCLKQVWALVPEEDEALFFDNIQAAERQGKKWADDYKPPQWKKRSL